MRLIILLPIIVMWGFMLYDMYKYIKRLIHESYISKEWILCNAIIVNSEKKDRVRTAPGKWKTVYTYYINYNLNGITYENCILKNKSEYNHKGEEVVIYVNPSNPNENCRKSTKPEIIKSVFKYVYLIVYLVIVTSIFSGINIFSYIRLKIFS